MKRKLFLPFLLLAALSWNQVTAQCTATLTSSGDCYPFTLTATANYSIDTIIWKKNNTVVQTYVAALNNGVVVAGGNGQGSAANQFNSPNAMHVDAAGNIYVADFVNHRIQKWAPNATTGVTVAGGNGAGSAANQLNFPADIFVAANGDMYITDVMNQRVQKWAANATSGVTVAGGNGYGNGANQLAFPAGIFLKGTDLFVMDSDNARVQKWAQNATSGVTVAGGNGFGSAANQIGTPSILGSIFVDAGNNIYITEYGFHRVSKWAPNATSGVIVAGGNGQGSAANQLFRPLGILVDNNGGVYVTEEGNNRVQYWPAGATVGTTVAGGNGLGAALNQLSAPVDLAKFNDTIYVCETGNRRVIRFVGGAPINNTYIVTTPGEYKAIVKSTSGCADSASVTIDFPTDILITPADTLHLCAGSNVTLNATSYPTLSYQWTKDNANVGADVDTLSINQGGSYKVITNVNGNCIDTTDAVTALIHDLPIPTITNTNNVLTTGTFSTYQWYRNTVLIPGATSSSYTATENGSYTVTVTNEHECSGTSVVTTVSGIVGIKDVKELDGVMLYPNPATKEVTLNIPQETTALQIEIYNLQGQLLLTKKVPFLLGAAAISMDISALNAGVYFLKLNTKEGYKSFKLTKL